MERLEKFGQGRFGVEYRIIRPDGSVRWIYDRGFPVHDEQGRVVYMTGIAEDVTERKAAEEMKHLRDLAAHLQSAREEERKRISREIHDELGQVLTGLKLELSWAARHSEPSRVRERLEVLPGMIDGAVEALHKITAALRPDALDAGLVDAISWQAGEFERHSSIYCSLELPVHEVHWDPDHSTAMFRIMQEALTNVARHADASTVYIRLREERDQVILEVEDDGCGISRDDVANTHSFGLLGMQERARLAGGTLSVKGRAGEGTTVTVKLPLA
jgi:signal transduction histidine kinase